MCTRNILIIFHPFQREIIVVLRSFFISSVVKAGGASHRIYQYHENDKPRQNIKLLQMFQACNSRTLMDQIYSAFSCVLR